jgi:hypothetical protein
MKKTCSTLFHLNCAFSRPLQHEILRPEDSEETFRLARAAEVPSKLPNLVFWQGLEPPDAALGRN